MTGTGTAADPYAVSTWDELMTVLPQEGKYAVLTDDIDMLNVEITIGNVVLACNFDGQEHTIRNVYLSDSLVSNNILFKMRYAITFQNVRFENWYSNDVWIFNGDSAHPFYNPMPTFRNISFSGELVGNAHLVSGDWTTYYPIFNRMDIYAEVHSNSVVTRSSNLFPHFVDSTIELHGECNRDVVSVNLDNSVLTGEVKILNAESEYNALNIRTSQSVYQSLIDIKLSCDTSCTVAFLGEKLLVNTDNMTNITTSGTFIACTDEQQNDEQFLTQHGFILGDTPSAYSWSDWLASITSTAYYDTSSNEHFLTYDTNNGKYNINIVDLPNNCYTRNMPVWDWQSGEYYFTASSYKKYRCVVDVELPEGVYPLVRFFRNGNGDDWSLSGVGDDVVIQAPYATSSFTVNIGVYNKTGHSITENATFNNVTIYEHSSWNIVNGKLQNSDAPQVQPIGAFNNCSNLTVVYIPPSVKKIGKYAFHNTALTGVMIAQDCEYYDTSFPDGCAVNFYPD